MGNQIFGRRKILRIAPHVTRKTGEPQTEYRSNPLLAETKTIPPASYLKQLSCDIANQSMNNGPHAKSLSGPDSGHHSAAKSIDVRPEGQ